MPIVIQGVNIEKFKNSFCSIPPNFSYYYGEKFLSFSYYFLSEDGQELEVLIKSDYFVDISLLKTKSTNLKKEYDSFLEYLRKKQLFDYDNAVKSY